MKQDCLHAFIPRNNPGRDKLTDITHAKFHFLHRPKPQDVEIPSLLALMTSKSINKEVPFNQGPYLPGFEQCSGSLFKVSTVLGFS
jgi:hypothetical protein